MPWAAAAAVVGAGLSASASNKASKAQAKSAKEASDAQLTAARESNALQKEIYDQNRADATPWRNTGVGALNELSWRMGLDTGPAQNSLTPRKSRDTIYNELLSSGKYTIPGTPATGGPSDYAKMSGWAWDGGVDYFATPVSAATGGTASGTDYAGLNAEVDRLYNASSQDTQGQPYSGDPGTRGELMRDFTMADRDADPVYQSGLQFGLQQGVQGLERQASAGGMQLSGATLKALTRFGNDYGTTKAQGAYDRFNQNKTTKYNRLAGISGTGQTATNQIAQLGQNYAGSVGANNMNTANIIGANTIGAGNARAASYLSQGQSWGNALNSLSNLYSQNNMLNQSRAGDSYKGSSNAYYLD